MLALRFCVLHHTKIAEPHYDLMIESAPGGPLLTWRCSAWPVASGDHLTRTADHRRAFLDYEGAVSRDRGVVQRLAAGTCEVVWEDTTHRRCEIRFNLPQPALMLTQVDGDQWVVTDR